MLGKNGQGLGKRARFPHIVVKEQLANSGIDLTNFYFRYGANIYVLTYEKNGVKKHTFIDAGYIEHQRVILPILEENGISLKNIENIIITHRHPDHCGLAALLAAESGSRILVHANFKDFVEGNASFMERRWLRGLDPTQLAKCNMTYLEPQNGNSAITINGTDFPRMGSAIEIGEGCKLDIVTCPKSKTTHSPDQLMILYSPRQSPYTCENLDEIYLPTDEIIFSGDLWLMQGPLISKSMSGVKHRIKMRLIRFLFFLMHRGISRPTPQEQDVKAKDALKNGFCLIRVKPGHGREFLGSNLIPKALMADRDLLVHLGFSLDEDKSILKSDKFIHKVEKLKENAYQCFIDILNEWITFGYSHEEISHLLTRIYKEQSGGAILVEQDRKERRERLKNTLKRLKSEKTQTDDLHQVAVSTLLELKKI